MAENLSSSLSSSSAASESNFAAPSSLQSPPSSDGAAAPPPQAPDASRSPSSSRPNSFSRHGSSPPPVPRGPARTSLILVKEGSLVVVQDNPLHTVDLGGTTPSPRLTTKTSWSTDEQSFAPPFSSPARRSPFSPALSVIGGLRTRASSWDAESKRNLNPNADGSWARIIFASGRDLIAQAMQREELPVSQPPVWRQAMFLFLCALTSVYVYRLWFFDYLSYDNFAETLLLTFVCRALWPFSVSSVYYLMLSNPSSSYYVLEVLSVILVAFQAASNTYFIEGEKPETRFFGTLKEKIDNLGEKSSFIWPVNMMTQYFNEREYYKKQLPLILSGEMVFVLFAGALLLKFRHLASQLDKPALQTLVWTTNPKVYISTMMGLAFFSAPLISCLATHHHRALKAGPSGSNPEEFFEGLVCEDVSYSSYLIKTALTNSQFMAIFVTPTVLRHYTTRDYTSFSLLLQHQLTGGLFALGGIMSLYSFATADSMDSLYDWMIFQGTTENYVDSAVNRKRAYAATLVVMSATILCTYPSSFAWVPSKISNFGENFRAHLMNRSTIRLAPAYRIICVVVALAIFGLVLALVVVGIIWSESDEKDKSAYTYWNLEQLCIIFAPFMGLAASFSFMSKGTHPGRSLWHFATSNQLVVFVNTIAFVYFLSGAVFMKVFEFVDHHGVRNSTQTSTVSWPGPRLSIWISPMWIVMLLIAVAIPSAVASVSFTAREILATYGEGEIHKFLQKMLVSTVSVIPSMFFICSQSFACVLQKGKDLLEDFGLEATNVKYEPDQCVPFLKFNLVVINNVTLGLLLFFVTGFLESYTIDDYVKFSDPSLPFFIHLVCRGLASVGTAIAYGARPDPDVPMISELNIHYGLFIDLLFMANTGCFFAELLSANIKLTAVKHAEDKIIDDDIEDSLFQRFSHFVLRVSAVPLKALTVNQGDISMSPIFRYGAFAASFANSITFFASIVTDGADGVYLARIAETNLPLSCLATCFFVFSDLNPIEAESTTFCTGVLLGRRSRRFRVAVDVLAFLPFLLSASVPFVEYRKNLETVAKSSISPVLNLFELCLMFFSFFLLSAICVVNKYIIVSKFGTLDLKEHLNRVAYITFSLFCAACTLAASSNSCTIREKLEFNENEKLRMETPPKPFLDKWDCDNLEKGCAFQYTDNRCETIRWSQLPLYFLITLMACYNMWFGIFHIETPITFERMSLLRLSKVETIQSVVIGSCGATAVFMYGVGGEYGRDLRSFYVYPMQVIFLFLVFLLVFEEIRILVEIFYFKKDFQRRDDVSSTQEALDKRRGIELQWRGARAATFHQPENGPRKKTRTSSTTTGRVSEVETDTEKRIGGATGFLQLDPGLM